MIKACSHNLAELANKGLIRSRHQPIRDEQGELCLKICNSSRSLEEHVPLAAQTLSATEHAYAIIVREMELVGLLDWQQIGPHAKSPSQ